MVGVCRRERNRPTSRLRGKIGDRVKLTREGKRLHVEECEKVGENQTRSTMSNNIDRKGATILST